MEKEPEKEIYSTDNEKNPIRVCLVLFIFSINDDIVILIDYCANQAN